MGTELEAGPVGLEVIVGPETTMNEAMEASHKPSMNLRFVKRVVHEHAPEYGPDAAKAREIRVLQQMMVPKDWSKHDEYWQDVPSFDESALPPNATLKPPLAR